MAKLTLDAAAIGRVVVETLLNADEIEHAIEATDTIGLAEYLVNMAETVEFKPTARKLVITYDLSGDVVPATPKPDPNAEYAVVDDPAPKD